MSDQLRAAMNIAKAIQADVDAAGMGKPQAETMDALEMARQAFTSYTNDDPVHHNGENYRTICMAAHAYAAIAQAEAAQAQAAQLNRLNDMLANYFEIMVDGAITNEREP